MSLSVPGKAEDTKRGASVQNAATPQDTGTAGAGPTLTPAPAFVFADYLMVAVLLFLIVAFTTFTLSHFHHVNCLDGCRLANGTVSYYEGWGWK